MSTKTAALWLAFGLVLGSRNAFGQAAHVNVPHLVQVEPGVWRGGQPTDQGWRELRALGVTNVVKLNPEGEGSDAEAKQLGMTIYAAPIPFSEQLGLKELSLAKVEQALARVPAQGTFIHCEHGQDRTGLAVAIWRVQRDGWSKDAAEKEMLARGFHKELTGLWRSWKSFKPQTEPSSNPPPAP